MLARLLTNNIDYRFGHSSLIPQLALFFGAESTAHKILMELDHLYFWSYDTNKQMSIFHVKSGILLREVLAKIINKKMRYAQYQSQSEMVKEQIRLLLVIALQKIVQETQQQFRFESSREYDTVTLGLTMTMYRAVNAGTLTYPDILFDITQLETKLDKTFSLVNAVLSGEEVDLDLSSMLLRDEAMHMAMGRWCTRLIENHAANSTIVIAASLQQQRIQSQLANSCHGIAAVSALQLFLRAQTTLFAAHLKEIDKQILVARGQEKSKEAVTRLQLIKQALIVILQHPHLPLLAEPITKLFAVAPKVVPHILDFIQQRVQLDVYKQQLIKLLAPGKQQKSDSGDKDLTQWLNEFNKLWRRLACTQRKKTNNALLFCMLEEFMFEPSSPRLQVHVQDRLAARAILQQDEVVYDELEHVSIYPAPESVVKRETLTVRTAQAASMYVTPSCFPAVPDHEPRYLSQNPFATFAVKERKEEAGQELQEVKQQAQYS